MSTRIKTAIRTCNPNHEKCSKKNGNATLLQGIFRLAVPSSCDRIVHAKRLKEMSSLIDLCMNLKQQVKLRQQLNFHIFDRCPYGLLLLGILMWSLMGCNFSGRDRSPPQIKLTIQNTLPIKRLNVPIVLTLEELRSVASDFSFDVYLVNPSQRGPEIHSQTDDINYDGQKDELIFLVDLAPRETKEVSILYEPRNTSNYRTPLTLEFPKRTRSGIFPEFNGLAALESELIAYVLHDNGSTQAYGKREELLFNIEPHLQSELDYRNSISVELRQSFEKNGFGLSQNITVEVRTPESSWLIIDQHRKQTYSVRKEENQLNVYKAKELSIDRFIAQTESKSDVEADILTALTPSSGLIGCGGFALWDKINQELISPTDVDDYVRVLADGPVRSVVQRIIPNLPLNSGTIQLTSTTMIYAGHQWGEHHIEAPGLTSRYCIATGVPNDGYSLHNNAKEGWLWTRNQPALTSPPSKLDMGVIFPPDRLERFQELVSTGSDTKTYTVLMNPSDNGKLVYRFSCVWKTDEMKVEEEVNQYVQFTAAGFRTPPVIKFLPQSPTK